MTEKELNDLMKAFKELEGLWEVYDSKTGKVIFMGTDYWKCRSKLYDGTNLWDSKRNKLEMRKVKTKMAKALYGKS